MIPVDFVSGMTILLVDDEPDLLKLISEYVSSYEFLTPVKHSSPTEALKWAKSSSFDIAVVDYKMPEMNGLELIEKLKKSNPDSHFILMTAHGNLEIAIEAIKTGVSDFITKPFNLAAFKMSIDRITERIFLSRENETLKGLLREEYGKNQLISRSDEMIAIREKVKTFANSTAPVLITGETGVGKEIVARMFHDNSGRRGSHFVAVNCSAYAETLFESELFGHEAGAFTGANKQRIGRLEYAQKGTLLLDEVSEMPVQMQVKLLRVLQEKQFERVGGNKTIKLAARIISATNKNPEEAIEHGLLRNDLYYRLNAIQVHIPPLRERTEDIEPIAKHFMKKFSVIHTKKIGSISENVMELFYSYSWPGNVRQLENVIDYAVVSCNGDEIMKRDLPEELKNKSFSVQPLIGIQTEKQMIAPGSSLTTGSERDKIVACLEKNRWIKTKAASELGMTRSQLLYRMKKFDIA